MKQRQTALSAALACSLLLAACSGGSTGTTAVPQAPISPQGMTATAKFVVSIPHASIAQAGTRRPKYITAAVKGIDFSVTSNAATGTPAPPAYRGYVFYPLTPQSTYCTNGTTALTCTLAVQAWPGSDLITVNTYDQANPSTPGSNNGPSHVVSTGYVTATIAPQQSNQINITTQGVVSHVQVSLDNPYPTGALTQPLHVMATDADDNVIIGAYDMPLSVTDSDTSGATSLSTAAIADSSVVPQVTYTGAAASPATFSVQSTSPVSVQNSYSGSAAAGSVVLVANGMGITASPSSLYFAHPNSAAQSITLGGPGTVAPYFANTVSDGKNDPTCIGIVSVSVTSPIVTVTPVGAGTCWLKIYDSTTPTALSAGFPITVSP